MSNCTHFTSFLLAVTGSGGILERPLLVSQSGGSRIFRFDLLGRHGSDLSGTPSIDVEKQDFKANVTDKGENG
jgi:hypothetical protein